MISRYGIIHIAKGMGLAVLLLAPLVITQGVHAQGVQDQGVQDQGAEAQEIQEVQAQEQGDAAAEPAPPDRSRVLYLDVPVPIEPGVDPVVPDPFSTIPVNEEDPVYQARTASIQRYNETVATIEAEGGAWDQALVEQLAALARLQQQQGNHTEAADLLQRTMHISRVNAGLHTLEQVPVIEQMLASYTALGDWEQVDLYQNYLYYVQERAYGVEDPRIIPVLERLGSWNIEAFTIGFGEALGLRLSTAQMMFASAVHMVGLHFGRGDERFVNNLRNVARSAYLVHRYPSYVLEINRPEYRTIQDQLRDKLHEPGSSMPGGYLAGLEALTDIVDYYEDVGGQPVELAEAITHLADWNLVFEQRRTAAEHYGRAWQILADLENSEELLRRFFGQVITLPTYAQMPTNLRLGSSDSQERVGLNFDYVDVSLTVTENGEPRDVAVLTEETEDNRRQLGQLRREIRDSWFRPLVVDGEPEPSEGHLFRYRYWY